MSVGLVSPKSCSQQTLVLDNPDWAYFEEGTKQAAQIVPSTPFPHKYKTELCKNWENEGSCVFGNEVSKDLPKNILVLFRSRSQSTSRKGRLAIKIQD